jgi:hypothetical protein
MDDDDGLLTGEKDSARAGPKRRDDLMISLTMARIIMVLGFLGSLLQPIFAGVSLFFVLAQYAMLPKFYFLAYYAFIGSSLSFGYYYVCLFSGIINAVYTMWAWLAINKRYAQILYSVSLGLSLITLILSIVLMKSDQMFASMANRNRDWFLTSSPTALADWESRVFSSYQVTDLFRSILFLIQAVSFAFAHYSSHNDFGVAMMVSDF